MTDRTKEAIVSVADQLRELDAKMVPAPWAYDINEKHETASLIYDWIRFARFDGREYLGAEHTAHPLGVLRNALTEIAAVIEAAEGRNGMGHKLTTAGDVRCPDCLHPAGAPWHTDYCTLGPALAALARRLEQT